MTLSQIIPRGILALLLVSMMLIATSGWAATPVDSVISLESFAQVCIDDVCSFVVDQQTAADSDVQTTTLDPLSVTINATAGDQLIGPGANAALMMDATFLSVSSGTLSFLGETGIRRPTSGTPGSCTAMNSASDGFSYTFVASTDGFLNINYNIECAPISSTTALGNLEIYVDGTFWASAVATATNQTASGTLQRPIQNGTTHTFRIKPNLNSVSGNSCGVPPALSWGCAGGAGWSFDVASPSPVPSPAGSWSGALLVTGCLAGAGIFVMRRQRMGRSD